MEVASIGQVDCVTEQLLCHEQGVHGYPNIRVYPASSFGINQFEQYQSWMRDANNMHLWALNYFPTKTEKLDFHSFEKKVIRNEDKDNRPWLIDFYAPWCGHCHVFSPKFETIADVFKFEIF